MSDFWSDLATPEPVTRATAKPLRVPKPKPIPFQDAWLIFRVNDDGEVEDLRVAEGSHLNRWRAGEPRDWSHDLRLAEFGATPQAAWQEFCLRWRHWLPPQLADAMRAASRIEGLEWLAGQAEIYEEATR